jgi:hypothetical protein
MRFEELNENEILDTKYNLIWRKQTIHNVIYHDALQYLKLINEKTNQNWEIPSLFILTTIIEIKNDPNSKYPNMSLEKFWSSTPKYGKFDTANYIIDFSNGVSAVAYLDNHFAVRLVRNI